MFATYWFYRVVLFVLLLASAAPIGSKSVSLLQMSKLIFQSSHGSVVSTISTFLSDLLTGIDSTGSDFYYLGAIVPGAIFLAASLCAVVRAPRVPSTLMMLHAVRQLTKGQTRVYNTIIACEPMPSDGRL
jgi:hypothetical protein